MKKLTCFLIICFISASAHADTYTPLVSFKIDSDMALKLVETISDPIKTGDTFKNVPEHASDSFFRVNEQTYDFINIWDVNPWTGEVWNVWSCEKRTSSEAKKLQAKIRKSFTSDELKEYKQLSAIKPEC